MALCDISVAFTTKNFNNSPVGITMFVYVSASTRTINSKTAYYHQILMLEVLLQLLGGGGLMPP
jgi:hypothetical protein